VMYMRSHTSFVCRASNLRHSLHYCMVFLLRQKTSLGGSESGTGHTRMYSINSSRAVSAKHGTCLIRFTAHTCTCGASVKIFETCPRNSDFTSPEVTCFLPHAWLSHVMQQCTYSQQQSQFPLRDAERGTLLDKNGSGAELTRIEVAR
jgi:hypothetical protein